MEGISEELEVSEKSGKANNCKALRRLACLTLRLETLWPPNQNPQKDRFRPRSFSPMGPAPHRTSEAAGLP